MTNRRLISHASTVFAAVSSAACVFSAHASVQISSKPTQNMSCSAGVCTATAQKAVFNASDLAGMLTAGDVRVESGGGAKDIEVNAALSWTSANRLTLDSYRSITFSKPVVVAGNGTMTITTNDGGSGGDFGFRRKGHIEFWNLSSDPVVNGHEYALVGNMITLAKLARLSPFVALAKTIKASRQSYTSPPIKSVKGTVEGFGNTISNFTLVDATPSDVCVGLIGCDDQDGSPVVRDIRMRSVNVTGTQTGQQVGALTGANFGSMIGCSVSGQVSATGQHANVGGLAGNTLSGSSISRSYSTASVAATSSNSSAGGLAGEVGGTVGESFATGTATVGSNSTAGGLVGVQGQGTISNSYAMDAVSGGSNSVVGGFIGSNTAGLHITASYSSGAVNGEAGSTIGGFIGADFTSAGLSDVYWDLDSSGISDPSMGAGNVANDPGVMGLTTTQLKSGLPSGFSLSVWAEKGAVNGGYPYLVALDSSETLRLAEHLASRPNR
jgi:hypothetical protein